MSGVHVSYQDEQNDVCVYLCVLVYMCECIYDVIINRITRINCDFFPQDTKCARYIKCGIWEINFRQLVEMCIRCLNAM